MTSDSIMSSTPFMSGASTEAIVCASPQDTSILSHWERQRQTTPDNTAVVADDVQWSYQELGQQVDRFASALIDAKVTAGDHVGICVDRSPEAIAAMLGVMKIGAAFVPLDPDYPADRIAYMVADANLSVILGHQHYRSQMGEVIWNQCDSTGKWIDCEDILRSNDPAPDRIRLLDLPRPTDLAYIMYTSGSTGKPKGVEIEHGALATYCFADIECYRLREDDRTLQFSTLCFDIAIEEIFPPLLCGSTVVVRPKTRGDDANELTAMIDRYQVTAIHVATAYWHSWVDLMIATGASVPESLRLVIVTGEKVSVEHYKRWRSICRQDLHWCNAYGPTEATVTATVFVPEGDFDGDNMPIGKPLPRYTAHILDKKLKPVDEGETGELYLGGPALARGYHRRDDLTERAFVNVTLDDSLTDEPARLYRTGDLARWLPDGNIDFGGRVDHQIKLGSYRIEPAEIESVLNRADGVLESLVSYDEVDGKKFLVAYIARGSAQVSASDLADFARQSLPAYMIPVRYVLMDSFPKTINGKIDREKLPSPNTGEVAGDANRQAPRNELERKLATIWCEVLNLPEIGIHDDFFLLGGSSLLVTQVITQLNVDFQIEMPVRDFFANPTVATAASQINRLLGREDDDLADENAAAIREALPTIHSTFIASDSEYLYSVRYAPRKKKLGRGVVLAHSIGHEYTRGYRNLQQLAIQLCSAGFDVLRFDYAGTGNSTGDCDSFRVETMRQNLIDARNHLLAHADVNSVDVVGLRLGAAIAATTPRDVFSNVVLWDPVGDGHEFLASLDRFHDSQLGELTRYNVRRHRNPDIDQAYGHAMSLKKRDSIASLKLPSDENPMPMGQTHCVLTSGETLPPGLQTQHVREVSDVIAWDDDRYLESAFSSPESFQAIEEILLVHGDANASDRVDNLSASSTLDHNEVAVTFGQHEHLSGVWNTGDRHLRGADQHETAVIFLTAGMLHHAGPFRLHTNLASTLGEHAIPSLRFDLSGIGESLAVGSQTVSMDRAADEVRQAMDWMETHHDVHRFVLFGLCSGADDALHVANTDDRVAGIVAMDGCGYPTPRFHFHRLVNHYLVRILRPSKWLKLLRGKLRASDQTVASLGFGEDIREFPERQTAESQLCQFAKQGRNAHFIYTGGVGNYYNHDQQFSDMFPRLSSQGSVTHAFYPNMDHVAFLVEDREILIQHIVDTVLQFTRQDNQETH